MEKILNQLHLIEEELEKDQYNARLWMEHGIGRHLLGEYEKAVESFRHSLHINNENHSCHYNMANSLMELESIEQAIHHYLQALELEADHTPSLNNLADAFELIGKPEKAHEIFHYLIKLNPGDPLSHFNLGNFFVRQGQHIEAAKCYEKTLSLDDSFADAYYNIAWILSEVQAYDKATEYCKKGLEADPEHRDLKKLSEQLEDQSEPD